MLTLNWACKVSWKWHLICVSMLLSYKMISVYNISIRIMVAILDFGQKWQFAMGGFGWTFSSDLVHQRWTHFRWKSFVNIVVQPPLILSLHCLDYPWKCLPATWAAWNFLEYYQLGLKIRYYVQQFHRLYPMSCVQSPSLLIRISTQLTSQPRRHSLSHHRLAAVTWRYWFLQ